MGLNLGPDVAAAFMSALIPGWPQALLLWPGLHWIVFLSTLYLGAAWKCLPWPHSHLPPLLGLALGRNFMTPSFFISTLGLIASHLPPRSFPRGSHRLVRVI